MSTPHKPLAGKVALVTGGARGLGAATAKALADQGADVAVDDGLDQLRRLGRLDIVVNSASIDRFGTAHDTERDEAVFEHYWAVANAGFRAIVRAASRVMGDGGRFVFVGSNLGVRPGAPGMSDMASIKAAIDGYARGAARDLAERGITVNVVHAGFMETDINAHMRDAITPLLQNLCIKRFGLLEEVIAPILFLASPAASYITGTIIDADGGYNV